MQTIGHIYDRTTGEKILILVRQCSYYRSLKLRKSGKDGSHFGDEENFLNDPEQRDRLQELKHGKVISC